MHKSRLSTVHVHACMYTLLNLLTTCESHIANSEASASQRKMEFSFLLCCRRFLQCILVGVNVLVGVSGAREQQGAISFSFQLPCMKGCDCDGVTSSKILRRLCARAYV